MSLRVAVFLLIVGVALGLASAQGPSAASVEVHIVFTRGVDIESQAIWIADLDGRNARRLVRGHAGFISPDGQSVAFQTQSNETFVISSRGRPTRRLLRTAGIYGWSPDSRSVLLTQRGRLILMDVDTLRQTVLERSVNPHYGWSFSPDGNRIAYAGAARTNRCDVSDVYSVAIDGTSRTRLTNGRRAAYPVWDGTALLLSRVPADCVSVGIWTMHEDGSGLRPILARPPRQFRRNGYYGFRVYGRRDPSRLVIGLRSEWGDEAAVLNLRTKKIRRLGGFVERVSRDGKFAIGTTGAPEFPFAIVISRVDGGKTRTIARGRVCCADWNR